MKLSTIFLFLSVLILGCGSDDSEPGDGGPSGSSPAQLTISDITTEEDDEDSNVFVRIQLTYSGTLDGEVTAKVSTVEGTAKAGSDYEAITGQALTFSESAKVQEVKIKIIGDEEVEADETFVLELSEVTGATFTKGTATITIKDNDNDGGSTIYIPGEGFISPESYPGMSLLWSDEFSESAVNTSNWTFELGNGDWGWGNNELQFYRAENTTIEDGNLVITAKNENFGSQNYTSSRMITKGKFDFKYGRVDIRAVMPYGQGMWPALWMLGSNISSVSWPSCGEIDIMEMVGSDNATTHGTIHFSNNNGDHVFHGEHKTIASGKLADEFHVYSIIWDETSIKWLLDDVQFQTQSLTPGDRSELKEKQFLIFNVAVGGQWPGSPNATTVFPQHMIVDYVRVFQ